MKRTSRILSLLLCLAMLLALTACSSRESNSAGSSSGAGSGSPSGSAKSGTAAGGTAAAGSEYVYTASFADLKLEGEGSDYLSFVLAADGGYYAYRNEVVGQRELRANESFDYEGQLDRRRARLYFVAPDGTARPVDGYTPVDLPEVAADHDISANATVLLRTDDGFLEILEVSEGWVDAPEGVTSSDADYWRYWKSNSSQQLRKLDATGAVQHAVTLDVSRVAEEGYFSIYSAAVDDGKLIACSDKLCLFDIDSGALLSVVDGISYAEKIIRLSDGRLAVGAWGDNGPELTVLADGKLGEKLPVSTGVDLYHLNDGSGDYLYYYSDGTSFYGAKADGDEKLFNWVNCDVNPVHLSFYSMVEDGNIMGIETRWRNSSDSVEMDMVTLRRVPASSLPARATLTLATQGLGIDPRDAIIAFNRSHPMARIEVVDYSEYNTENDYSAGLTKLKTEILSGRMPDILDLNQMPTDQLGARGLLQDLYPFLDADSEITRASFFPTLLTALEEGGKLYGIPSSFSIITLAAASELVGSEPGWTVDELEAALRELPEGASAFSPYTGRSAMLRSSMILELDRYVNWETGEVNFTDPSFAELLKYCAQFPDESTINYETIEDDDYERIISGQQLLTTAYLSDFHDLFQYVYLFGGRENGYTLIGYPTTSGVGSLFDVANSAYAITRDCRDSQLAWEFIRSMLSKDSQLDSYTYGFPTNRAAFDQRMQEAMTPQYEKDADGNYKVDANGERIERSIGGASLGNGITFQYYAVSQPMADKLMEAINNTTRTTSANEEILKIVTEQAEAFFAGDKSAEEVAKLIQSKANIYVNEQR